MKYSIFESGNCHYGILCALGLSKEALFVYFGLAFVIWYYVRKVQYQSYARKKYPHLDRRQLVFKGKSLFEHRRIQVDELRRRYFRYTLEVMILFSLFILIFFL